MFKRVLVSVVLVLVLSLVVPVSAHNFWLQDKEDGAHLFLGDTADDERYQEEDVLEASGGLGADGQPLEVERVYSHGHMHLHAPQAQVLWLKADYGFWRKTTRGWARGSKRSPGRTISSEWHVQYAKLVKKYTGPQPVGMELELVFDSMGEKRFTGRALLNGKPKAGLPIFLAHRKVARTDSEGRFKIKRPKGPAVISVVYKERLENHPDADKRAVTSTTTLLQP